MESPFEVWTSVFIFLLSFLGFGPDLPREAQSVSCPACSAWVLVGVDSVYIGALFVIFLLGLLVGGIILTAQER